MAKKGSKARALKRAQMEAALGILSESNVVAMDSTEELEIAPVTVYTDEQPSAIYATDDDQEMQFASEKVEESESEAEEIQAAADSEAEEIQAVTQSDKELVMTDVNSPRNLKRLSGIAAQELDVSSSSSSSPQVAALTEALKTVTIHTEQALTPGEQLQKDKEAYVRAKFNPTDPKEKARLEHRLKLYTYPDESRRKQDAETKRAALQEEFEAEFIELAAIKNVENEILETYAKDNFKPSSKWKIESQSTYDARIALERIEFIKANRQAVLLGTLQKIIRTDLAESEKVKELDIEENVQAAIDKPVNRTYEAHFTTRTPQAVKKLPQAVIGHAATPVHFSLKAKQLWSKGKLNGNMKDLEYQDPKTNPANFFPNTKSATKRSLKERELVLTAYQEAVASAASLVRTEKAVAEHTQKPFQRLGLKPKS